MINETKTGDVCCSIVFDRVDYTYFTFAQAGRGRRDGVYQRSLIKIEQLPTFSIK